MLSVKIVWIIKVACYKLEKVLVALKSHDQELNPTKRSPFEEKGETWGEGEDYEYVVDEGVRGHIPRIKACDIVKSEVQEHHLHKLTQYIKVVGLIVLVGLEFNNNHDVKDANDYRNE